MSTLAEPSAAPPIPPPSGLPHVVSSLASRDFRWLVLSMIVGTTANWMEIVVRSLVVYDLSGSAFMLGIVNGSKSVPMVFVGFVGGVLADRVDRRALLTLSQFASAAIAATLGTLVLTDRIEVWHFVAAGLGEGILSALQQPARQALVPSVVPRQHLMNAVALSGSVWNISRMIGPALAGAAFALAGPASALYAEGALYGCGALATRQIGALARPIRPDGLERGPGREGRGRRGEMGWIESFKGYGYLRENPVVGWLAVLALVPILFGIANQVLAPVFAKDVLHIGAGGIGLLLAAPGVGAVTATFLVASARDLPRKGLVTLVGVVTLGAATIVYALSTWIWLSLAALAVHGFGMTAYRAVNQTLVQIHTPDEYRGRVLAVYAADRGLHPVSALAVTFMTDLWSAPIAVAISGAGCLIVALGVALASRTIRELD